MINGQLNKEQLKEFKNLLKSLEFPPAKKQRLLWRLGKAGVITSSKRYAKQQQSPDGEKWAERQSPWRVKMLRKLPTHLHIKEMPAFSAIRIYIQGGGYRNGKKPVPAGVVGYAQQNGMSVTISSSSYNRNKKSAESDEQNKTTDADKEKKEDVKMATDKQARRLKILGYKVRKGKSLRSLSAKKIATTLTFEQAGVIIRKMKNQEAKKSWLVNVPARPFLGISESDFAKALSRQLQGIGFGWDVKAQDMKKRT